MIHANSFRTFWLLFYADGQRLKNNLTRRGAGPLLSAFTILILAFLFITIEFFVSQYLFQHIMDQVHLEALRYVLLSKLLQMVYIVFTILLIYSNVVMAISSFFSSPEVDLLHSRPISDSSMFVYRYIETFIRSSWMFIAFAMPIFYAYGRVLEPVDYFFNQIFLILIPSLIIPASLGVIIGILLILVFSPRRTQQVFLFLGIFLAVGLILVFRFMQPEKLIDPIGLEQVNFYLDTLRIPTIEWLPSTWASEGITAYGEGRVADNQMYSMKLWTTSVVLFLISFFIFKLFWFRARSGGRDIEIIDNNLSSRIVKPLPANQFRLSLFYRDLVLFRRDPSQWSQLIVIAALVIIYVFNFKNLPYELYGFQYSMSFVSVAASGMILSALLARFGFPSVSMEGKAIWVLQTGPINWRKYLWQKYFFLAVPAAFIGIVLVLFSVKVLDVNSHLMVKCLITETAIVCGCTGLAVGMGAIRPRFDLKDSAMVAVSSTGLWYMLFAISFVIFAITVVILPDLLRYFSLGYKWLRTFGNIDRWLIWFILGLSTTLVTIIPMNVGIHNLQKIS